MGWGDEIMAAGEARRAQEAGDPRPVAIVDPRRGGRVRWHPIWAGNPRIVTPAGMANGADVQRVVNGPGCRPYIAHKLPERWVWRSYRPHPAEIFFDKRERRLTGLAAGAVAVEPHIKAAASPNKDWGWDRWQALVDRAPDIPWVQLSPPGMRALKGVRQIFTRDFRAACAVLSGARAAVLPEGGLHHAAAALGVKAVVIFGGMISPANTGYGMHINLFDPAAGPSPEGFGPQGGESPCGMRVKCEHCARAMAAIKPEVVAHHLETLL